MDPSIASPRHQALAGLLRELRLQAGLSQSDLAALLGEPQSFVSKYEGGVRRLDLVELEQVAQALGSNLLRIVEQYGERT